MVEQPLCFFSVVRYVPDPIRNEAKNIGIVLLCPEKRFGKSKFLKSRFHLQRDSRRYATLQSMIRGYQIDLPGEYKENLYETTLFAPLPPQWTKADLEKLSRYAIKTLDFQKADLQRVEEAGGYYAHIWHIVQSETGAKGLWLVNPPSQSDAIEERFKLVTSWAEEAKIEVRNINETEEVAKMIAVEINDHSPSH